MKMYWLLRGDIPRTAVRQGKYHYASELIWEIKRQVISASEPHVTRRAMWNQPNKSVDIDYLKQKVEAGCDFVTTQMFLTNSILYSYLYRIR